MAWWRPPAGENACRAWPERMASAAATVAPQTRVDASCIPAKGGLSPGPKPKRAAPSPCPAALTPAR